MDSTDTPTETQIGRNEPCPCGSGKKYKRCCGVGAAPKLTAPAAMPQMPAGLGGGMPGMGAGAGGLPAGMDPAMMAQMGQLLQRLPKSQLQRLQSLMQKAMSGKDVSREAAEFEKTLPVEFQTMMRSMAGTMGGTMGAAMGDSDVTAPSLDAAGEMTEEEARRIVEAAAQGGQLSEEKAAELLQTQPGPTPAPSGLGKLFGKFGKR